MIFGFQCRALVEYLLWCLTSCIELLAQEVCVKLNIFYLIHESDDWHAELVTKIVTMHNKKVA